MPTRKKKSARPRRLTKGDLPRSPDQPGPSYERSFETFTKCTGCGEGSIDVGKYPIAHRDGCAYQPPHQVAHSGMPEPVTDRRGFEPMSSSKLEPLRQKIASAINSVSAENGSNTPDFILAHFLTDCLQAFDRASRHRSEWKSTNGVTSPEFMPGALAPAPAPNPRSNREQVQFPISAEQIGTFGAGWRQRLSGNAALPPNIAPARLEELKRLAIMIRDDQELGYAVMSLNGPEGFRP